jgi:hypothetical protein
MRKLLRAVKAAGIVIVLVTVALPVFLFTLPAELVQLWIKERWPDSPRAQLVRFWIRLLSLTVGIAVIILVLLVAIGAAIPRVREATERHYRLPHPGTPP